MIVIVTAVGDLVDAYVPRQHEARQSQSFEQLPALGCYLATALTRL